MANFDSPISKKQSIGNSNMREFVVDDQSGYSDEDVSSYQFNQRVPPVPQRPEQNYQSTVADHEYEIRKAREDKRLGRERISEGAKKRIEMLIGITRSVKEVDVEGTQFTFQTLKSKEMREAFSVLAQVDGSIHAPFEIRRQLLARSISKIAGIEIEEFIGNSSLDAKLMFIDELDEALLNRLYAEYSALAEESKNKFSVKTDNEAKEIVEDLKK